MTKMQEIPQKFTRGYLAHLDGRTAIPVEMREGYRAFTDDPGAAKIKGKSK